MINIQMIINLYVKQHTCTGLLYFGKTTKDPLVYPGSGKYWLNHINAHGRDKVETLNVWSFDNAEEARDFAMKFSDDHDITNSPLWANLKPEELDGGDTSMCPNYLESMRKRDLSGCKNPMYGRSAVSEQKLRWYTNGEENVYLPEGAQPEGFYRGRTLSKRKSHTQCAKDKMSSTKQSKGRRVMSPEGIVFSNRQEAADFLKCSAGALTERIRRGKSGWTFV